MLLFVFQPKYLVSCNLSLWCTLPLYEKIVYLLVETERVDNNEILAMHTDDYYLVVNCLLPHTWTALLLKDADRLIDAWMVGK